MEEDGWAWRYAGYDPDREQLREALCTLGNGYVATRGAAAESPAGGPHYPGTYAAGCYNRLTSQVAGRRVDNEDMVNLPNWLPLRVRPAGGSWFGPDDCDVLDYEVVLDLRRGTLERRMRLRDGAGRILATTETRLVHMGDPHLAAQRLTVAAEAGAATWRSRRASTATSPTAVSARYRDLDGRHLTGHRAGVRGRDTGWLRCRTLQLRHRGGAGRPGPRDGHAPAGAAARPRRAPGCCSG